MADIRPFPGILYRVAEAELPRVLAPPYDVITPEHQARLYERDPRNIVRVVLNRTTGEDAYREAGETYRRWLSEGVLAEDSAPALYVLEQEFEVDEIRHRRRGVLARFRAEDPETGSILPHEQTRKAPREDRYRLLRATRANFSPIFLMAGDARHELASACVAAAEPSPALGFTDESGVLHRLWRVSDTAGQRRLQEALADTRAYIADGHHRYATALRYRDEVGPEGAWTLGYFTPLDDPGLLVLPYHRVIAQGPGLDEARQRLQRLFGIHDASSPAAAAHQAAQSKARYAFGLAAADGGALVAESLPEAEGLLPASTPPPLSALDTFFVHQALLPRVLEIPEEAVRFVHSLAEAEQAMATRQSALALLLRPTPVGQIVDVAEARLSMPAKSTFFHPKLPSGLVIHPLVA